MGRLICFAIALLTVVGVMAQPQRNDERIESMRIAFITKTLDLTAEESQQFWPIYNRFKDETDAMKRDFKRDAKAPADLSNEEANIFIDRSLELASREVSLRKQFVSDLRPVLPPQKIAKLLVVEHQFKRQILEKARKRFNNKRKQRQRGGR